MPFDIPGWVVNTLLVGASVVAVITSMRSAIQEITKKLDAIQITTSETSSRLVKLETRLEALDGLRLDERLRHLEVAMAVSNRRREPSGEA